MEVKFIFHVYLFELFLILFAFIFFHCTWHYTICDCFKVAVTTAYFRASLFRDWFFIQSDFPILGMLFLVIPKQKLLCLHS